MPVKRCCVSDCLSTSTRNEDKGVTYHKFPKDANLRETWSNVAHVSSVKLVPCSFVCSRHFCRGDFIKHKDSKYTLKSDAIPSIFPWVEAYFKMESETTGNETGPDEEAKPNEENDPNISGSSKSSEIENLDNIKKFIEAQEKDIQIKKRDIKEQTLDELSDKNVSGQNIGLNVKTDANVSDYNVKTGENSEHKVNTDEGTGKTSLQMLVGDLEMNMENLEQIANIEGPKQNVSLENDEETMAVASSVMEMILSVTEANTMESQSMKAIPKQTINPVNSSMPLSVGSRVEAKDFSEDWYPVEIVEVDFDEMEVLVHYDNYLKKPDEWISVSSPRLRPLTENKPEEPELLKILKEVKEEPKEIKTEDKNKVFIIGERCLARWRDNRRFVATIDKDLGEGKFEVIFDDGFRWPCTLSRLSKLKEQRDALSIDTSLPSSSGIPSPILQGGPTSTPIYHTHLFDPTRDYLGSKSERREKKRKLNIKEIFNIGQKKQKVPKMPKEKKVVTKIMKPKVKEIKVEKTGMPNAVASIIGTTEVKHEIKEESPDAMNVDDFDSMGLPDDTTDSKSDLDPVDEEDKLEKFEKPDQTMHEEVMDKMKEVISKLEGGLKEEIEKMQSPKQIMVDSAKPMKSDTESLKTEDTDTVNDVLNSSDVSPAIDAKPDAPTTAYETPKETLEIAVDTELVEDKVSEVLSPSLIETSEADLNKIIPDDDTTKSDIEMGNESPRLDIDSQPILVDIDAPLDMDQAEETDVVKKPKKLKNKDLEKPKKKIKKEHKKKLFNQKWAEVDQVKSELFEMQQKMREMMREIEREKKISEGVPLPESYLVPGEWACRWVNGQPVGKVSEIEADAKPDATGKAALPRRSVEVEDKRLPEGWTKHMVRRSVGHSAGKWDVVLVSPENRRFHTKVDMRHYLETASEDIKAYEHALMDFGVHLKLSRKLGWITSTPDGATEAPQRILPTDSKSSLSPLVKRKTLSLKKRPGQKEKKKRPIKIKLQRRMHTYNAQLVDAESEASMTAATTQAEEQLLPALEEGFVWVGCLKVQVIDNLLRCPAEGCLKNFRNNTLLQMHIKHYHRELRKMMGATPKVLDLAAARSKPTLAQIDRAEKVIKVKIQKPPKREEPKQEPLEQEVKTDVTPTPVLEETPKIPRSMDSPKLRNALNNKPVKRPKVLLPMRRPDPEHFMPDSLSEDDFETAESSPTVSSILDFEAAISTHTVTKPLDKKKKVDKKQKSFALFSKQPSEDEEYFAMNSDELDTRSSFPRSGTPDEAKVMDPKTGMFLSSDPMEDQLDPSLYTVTETGERIKIVHMKREEIINCHCGFREEDGLMVQCELCLCWQHAHCHNIKKESEVPEKYTCSICLNPRRGRRSKRFAHDQERLYDGILPGAKADDSLRRSHELAGNLLRLQDALHALRLKHYVATKKDHPKLYLWAKDWEQAEIPYKLNSEYSDLSIMINGMDKENLPMKPDEPLADMRNVSEDDPDSDRLSQRDGQLGSQALLSGLLSSPSAASLELPISTSELERLAKTVQEAAAEWGGAAAPQPEAPIENEACRARLLKHIQCCQALLDSRLDSIEAQVAELESQDPSFGEHYETAEHYPHIKQTVQMLMRDLDTMEELGVIT